MTAEPRRKTLQRHAPAKNESRPLQHVFISYVREDKHAVDQICEWLRDKGVQVWLDRDQIMPGQRWQVAIRTAIENGAFFWL